MRGCASCSGCGRHLTFTLERSSRAVVHPLRPLGGDRRVPGRRRRRAAAPHLPPVREQLQRHLGSVHRRLLGGAAAFAMRAIWGTSFGFPGPLPVEPFKGYIRRNEYRRQPLLVGLPRSGDNRDRLGRPVAGAVEELRRQRGRHGPGPSRPRSESCSQPCSSTCDATTRPPATSGRRTRSRLTPVTREPARAACARYLTRCPPARTARSHASRHPLRPLGADRQRRLPGRRASARPPARGAAAVHQQLRRRRVRAVPRGAARGLGDVADAIWGHCERLSRQRRRGCVRRATAPPTRSNSSLFFARVRATRTVEQVQREPGAAQRGCSTSRCARRGMRAAELQGGVPAGVRDSDARLDLPRHPGLRRARLPAAVRALPVPARRRRRAAGRVDRADDRARC